MTWVDLAVLGVLAMSAILAFLRGFVREVLGIGAWVGAGFIAIWGFAPARPFIAHYMANMADWIVDWITGAALFIVSVFVLSMIGRWLSALTRGLGLGGLDRTLGMVFGLVRGAALVIAAYILFGLATPVEQWPEPVLKARLLDSVYEGAKWAVEHLAPPSMNMPPVYAPPHARQASAESLLRATPQGTPNGRPSPKPPARD